MKKADLAPADIQKPLYLPNICFLGSNVESGSTTAVVIHTGDQTYFGSLAASIIGERQLTGFDKGVNKFTWLMVSPLATTLGFVTLPPLYWLLLAIMLVCYVILMQVVKTWFFHKFGE